MRDADIESIRSPFLVKFERLKKKQNLDVLSIQVKISNMKTYDIVKANDFVRNILIILNTISYC